MNAEVPLKRLGLLVICLLSSAPVPTAMAQEDTCQYLNQPNAPATGPQCNQMEQVTILGYADQVRDVAGGASVISEVELEKFESTDVVRALRRTPGIAMQVEDGFGLRPNISIRGTPTERSSRITLLEDNVLIAPAPYSAPSAYYFPTFGRINSVEVLKGPASITQGPYTVGGALNLLSTPVPEQRSAAVLGEYGSFDTWRLHAWFGDASERAAFIVETHQWQSDGYQNIDRSDASTGLDKSDYVAKMHFTTRPGEAVQHFFDFKLQASNETSEQTYLGLTDNDFERDGLRRYTASGHDLMDNQHNQLTAAWRMEFENGTNLVLTGYNNEFERAWYKTEGIDFDGSVDPQSFQRTSWASVVDAVNRDASVSGESPAMMQAILDGADTPYGSIQLRNNSREYYSRGVQLAAEHELVSGNSTHMLQAGLRLHRDQEDRLQRNDTWQQSGGQLLFNATGLQGNAGNRIQDAEAFAAWIYDRIEWKQWTFAPGLRFESIDLSRVDYNTSGSNPASREPENIKSTRSNEVDVWIPGMGLLYDLSGSWRLVAGIHKGFSTPSNVPGVEQEESDNYELGLRYLSGRLQLDVMGFFINYGNLVGVCTNSSGGQCEPGDAFNGGEVHVPGVEINLEAALGNSDTWSFPLHLTYTWMNAEFQTSFDSGFFGEVLNGDPVPYIPGQQGRISLGAERDQFASYLSFTYVESVCTRARCDPFERTQSARLFDLSVHYHFNELWEIYALAENLGDEIYIAGRDPYGARADKPRSYTLGARFSY